MLEKDKQEPHKDEEFRKPDYLKKYYINSSFVYDLQL